MLLFLFAADLELSTIFFVMPGQTVSGSNLFLEESSGSVSLCVAVSPPVGTQNFGIEADIAITVEIPGELREGHDCTHAIKHIKHYIGDNMSLRSLGA